MDTQNNYIGPMVTCSAVTEKRPGWGSPGEGLPRWPRMYKELANETTKATAEAAAGIDEIQQNAAEVVHAVGEINNTLTASDTSADFTADGGR